ncbi:MAG: type II secretion system F family protein [Nitrososphaerota archaeon]
MRRRHGEGSEREVALLYLAALASTEPDDRTLVITAAETSGPIGEQLSVFKRASRLLLDWGYSVSESLRHSSLREAGSLRELSEKLSRASNIGLRLSHVVKNEYEKTREYLRIGFERSMDRVKTIGDVQATLMSSSSFLLVSLSIMSVVFSGVDSRLIIYSVAAALFSVVVLLSFYVSRVSGSDSLVSPPGYREWWLEVSEPFSLIYFMSCLIILPLATLFLGPDTSWWSYLILSVAGSVFASFLVYRMRRISRIERELPFLMKSMGESMSTLQIVEKAVAALLINDYGELTRHLRRLYLRIRSGISIPVAFRFLVMETNSRHVYEACSVLVEGIDKGAPMSELGRMLYDHLNDRLSMRRRREQVSSYIKGILIPTAVTVSGVMGLMSSLFSLLFMYSSLTSQILPLTPGVTPSEMAAVLMFMILVNSAGSGMVIHLAERKSWIHLCLYFSIILAASISTYLFMKLISDSLFESLTSYTEDIKEAVG